jgi:glutamyl-tRNA reductase
VKSAYHAAVKAGRVGPLLNAIFQRAFAAAKRVRRQTDIARKPVSVSSVAVELALRIFGRLDGRTALVLGAGEMSENTARQLVRSGVSRIFVANRTLAKARVLARRLQARALTLPKGLDTLSEADIVISSVGGSRPLLSVEKVREAMEGRREKPLALIDIGVPRNIDAEAGRVKSVHLFNIDDLSRTAQSNQDERSKAVAEAERILEEDIQELLTWLKHRSLVPAIRDLRERIESIRSREWEDYRRKTKDLDGKTLDRMERLTKTLSAQFLHASTLALKERGGEIHLKGFTEAVRGLFRFDPKRKDGNAS